MKAKSPRKPDPVRWPVLAELTEVLTASRRRWLAVEVVRALGWAVSCQLVLLPALALISSRQPHRFVWIAAMEFVQSQLWIGSSRRLEYLMAQQKP